jgi:cobalt/nickel transport system permease protein
MHIPDGFLSPPVWAAADVVSAGAVGYALRRVNREIEPARVPLMGVTAAFVFAAQMVNFPVAGGTSGHLLGGVLAAVLLGPCEATLVMLTVFAVQALLFQDGGVLALGANMFNMGLVGTLGGWAIYRLLCRSLGAPVSAGAAGWLAVMLGAACASCELALSGTAALRVVLPAMLGWHALIGLGEAAITAGAVRLVARARPDLLPEVA